MMEYILVRGCVSICANAGQTSKANRQKDPAERGVFDSHKTGQKINQKYSGLQKASYGALCAVGGGRMGVIFILHFPRRLKPPVTSSLAVFDSGALWAVGGGRMGASIDYGG